MRKSLSVAALAVLVVALLLATSFNTNPGTDAISIVDAKSTSSSGQIPLSSSFIENYSQAKQFQAGTIFDNQSHGICVDPLSQDFAAGDLNHDGISDVAVISKQTNDICIYNRSSNGALSIVPWRISKPGMVDMRSIAIGDLNNTGNNDIVVCYNDSSGYGHVSIFFQSQNQPYFNLKNTTDMLVAPEPQKVVIGKFDGASSYCIAIVCIGNSGNKIDVWRHPFKNPGNNEKEISIPSFTKSKFLAAGDCNGDGLEDLVVGNYSGNDVFIAHQPTTWTGGWSSSVIPIDGQASDVQLSDVTGDGKSDLIFADATNLLGYSSMKIYANNASNGNDFPANPTNVVLKTPLGPGSVAVGKLTSGSGTDLLALSIGYANVSAYFQNSQGSFGQYSNLTFPVDESPLKAIVDRSVTGHEGVFILCQGPASANGTLYWFSTNPKLTGNADADIFSGTNRPMTLATGKLANGNNIVATPLTASNKVLLSTSNNLTLTLWTQTRPVAAVFGKFTSKTGDDLAVINSGSQSISLYNGSRLLTDIWPYKNITLPFNPVSLSSKSLRGDGYDDLLIGYAQGCFILYNTENSQTFTLGSSENLGGSISGNRVAIVVSDFNKDGIASDVALLNTVTNRVEIYPRNLTGIPGSFYLHTPSSYLNATTNLMLSIALGDLDGSSGQDIAAVTQNGKLLIFLQPSYGFTSTSDFYPDSVIHLAGKPSSISVGDVNDDGLTDILIGYADSPRLAAYLRTGPATFVNTFNLTTGAAPAAVMAQDVNGDGRTDISCASPGSHSISIWFQNNLAPVAKIGGPSSQYRTVLTSFNVASSLDSYSDIGSLNYTWAFGDGTPGYGKTVSHAYQDIGKFNITLRVTDRGGLYTTNTLIITVLQTYPSADLTIWPELPSEGSWILFNDMSLRSTVSNSPIQTWQWMFDGVNGNITKNAKQRFGAGEHTVMLKVTDANGVTNSTPLRFFNVTEVQPMAGFTISSAKVGSPVYFNSTSSFAWTPIVIYNWSFGDGNMTSGANPSVEYTFNMKGSYQIALKVTDAKGFSDEMVQWLHVNPTLPKATISLDGQSIEGSLTKFIISTSSFNPIVSWNWSYDNNQTWHLSNDNVTGTSFTFANNGTYWVSLNVTERDGSWCLISILVDVQDSNPKILRFWAPEGLTCEMDQNVSFWATASSYKNITKYEWNFDYGNGGTWVASTPFQTNHTSWSFNKPGIHFVKVRVWDDDGYTEYYSYPGLEIRVVDQAATALSIESLALLALVIAIITTILIFLIYRTLVPVDEVFIIFQDGQLMAHQTRRIKPGMDDDILASMFVAIQMFVKDSFKDESSTGLNRMDFGKKKILVEKGESFYLAVVLHSNRTGSIPKRMQIVIDDIQKNYGPALKVWDGDLEKVRGVKDSVNSLVKRKRPFGNK